MPFMMRVLLVDDHAGNRSVVRALLDGSCFTVIAEAEGVAGALVAIAEHSPDLVVLDVQLGDGSAFEVLEVMGASMPPTVLMSSRDAQAYGDRAEAEGVIGFLGKHELNADALCTLVTR
jgi:DNA-binding NarL/FixJ family response regulator